MGTDVCRCYHNFVTKHLGALSQSTQYEGIKSTVADKQEMFCLQEAWY